jgi:hypothetical protein
MKVDPVTQLDYPETERKFVPGVDFVAAGIAVALVLFGASFLFRGDVRTIRVRLKNSEH